MSVTFAGDFLTQFARVTKLVIMYSFCAPCAQGKSYTRDGINGEIKVHILKCVMATHEQISLYSHCVAAPRADSGRAGHTSHNTRIQPPWTCMLMEGAVSNICGHEDQTYNGPVYGPHHGIYW